MQALTSLWKIKLVFPKKFSGFAVEWLIILFAALIYSGGVLLDFDLVGPAGDDGSPGPVVMRAHVFGESIEDTDEVLFITTVIEGEENGELEAIVRSLRLLP